MSLTKFFYYTDLDSTLFGADNHKWPVQGLKVGVTYGNHYGEYQTGLNGAFVMNGVPSGDYVFNWTWNGEASTKMHSICCAQKDWVFENFVDAKGHT